MRVVILAALLASICGSAALASPVGITGTYYVGCKTITGSNANSTSLADCFVSSSKPSSGNIAGTVEFSDSLMTSGWDTITVVQDVTATNGYATDSQKVYALGYGEGYLTNMRLENNYNNQIRDVLPTPGTSTADDMYAWIDSHLAYMRGVAQADDSYGTTLSHLLAQLAGMADGYQAGCNAEGRADCSSIGFNQVFYMNFAREFSDLVVAFNYSYTAAQKAAYKDTLPEHLVGHCSALIKPMPDDVYVSHVTWSAYNSMMRVFKSYSIGSVDNMNTVTFSSYNGLIFSQDDWYMTANKLSVMETTNGVYNDSLFVNYLKPNPNVVSSFLRVMLSNNLAKTSNEWANLFVTFNSGTYNNQWMVLDMKVVTPGSAKPFPKDSFWVIETLPNMHVSGDVSEVVNTQGYWASYNTPYFKQVYDLSGNQVQFEQFGDFFSYTNTTRAKIFARNQTQIKNLDDFKALMRYNDYKFDPLSIIPNCTGATNNTCNPDHSSMLAISARGDLMPADAKQPQLGNMWMYFAQRPHAGTDCKVTTYKYMTETNTQSADVIVGPTTYNYNPVFEWKNSPWVLNHDGLPPQYNFSFIHLHGAAPASAAPAPQKEVDSVVKAIGYSIAGVGGLTVILTLIILVVCACKKAPPKSGDAAAYTQI